MTRRARTGAVRRPVLLTVSGSMPGDLDERLASGRIPRPDYVVMAARLGADLVDVDRASAATGTTGRLLLRFGGPGPLLGWYAFRRRRGYEVILSDGEQVGLPLALLTRVFGRAGSRHVMITHVLTVPKKMLLFRLARLRSSVDRLVVYCSRQLELIRDELGVDARRLVHIPFMVDTAFFAPGRVPAEPDRRICSAGLERRDYPTLLAAVDGLDVEVVIAAASPWSKQSDRSTRGELPPNVRVERFDHHDLRALYASCRLVVMPLQDVDFQAGITTILEAMAMELPVVCTRTRGQIDTIVDDRTGVYVPLADVGALRLAIERLLADRATSDRIGAAARRWVVEEADVERYADRIASIVDSVRDETAARSAR